MRRCRVLSGLQPLPNVGRIRRLRRIRQLMPDATLSRLIRPTNRYRLASGNCGLRWHRDSLLLFKQLLDYARIGKRRGIAQVAGIARRNFAQNTAHNFAGAGFRQGVGPVQHVWRRQRANLFTHPVADFCVQFW